MRSAEYCAQSPEYITCTAVTKLTLTKKKQKTEGLLVIQHIVLGLNVDHKHKLTHDTERQSRMVYFSLITLQQGTNWVHSSEGSVKIHCKTAEVRFVAYD